MSRPVTRRVVLGGAVAGAAGVALGAPAAAAASQADLSFPATRLARSAHKLVADTQQPFLRNHSLRSFLFARAAAGQQGRRPDEDYDLELVYLISVLHDMGLTDQGNADNQQFEAAGADLAARFMESRGVTDRRVDTVWEAIALHTSELHESPVFRRRRPTEIGIALAGIAIDAGEPGGADRLPPGFADRVHALYPRLGSTRALIEVVLEQGLANPRKAPQWTLAGEGIHQRHPSLPYFTVDMLLDSNPWGD
ncbi:MAG TPA: HD domain-containing protein [Gemmatimonadales bacterium]|nr:HD domain-containing protein [Gemmatimonadales bacterium]